MKKIESKYHPDNEAVLILQMLKSDLDADVEMGIALLSHPNKILENKYITPMIRAIKKYELKKTGFKAEIAEKDRIKAAVGHVIKRHVVQRIRGRASKQRR